MDWHSKLASAHELRAFATFPIKCPRYLDSNKIRTFTQEKWWPWWSSQHSYTVQVGCIWGLWWLMVLQRPRGFGDGGFDLCRGEWISGSAVTDCLPGATLKCLRWPSPAPESHRTLCTWGWTTREMRMCVLRLHPKTANRCSLSFWKGNDR